MKKIILFFIVLFAYTNVSAGILMLQMDSVKPAGGTVNISDDFSGTLSNWTQDIGTWSIVTGELSSPSDAGGIISYNTSLSGLAGSAIIQRGTVASSQFGGIGFRFVDSSSRSYVVRWNENVEIVFRECTGVVCENIGAASSGGMSATNYFGLSWNAGTGNSIVVNIWRFGASPPANKYDSSTWGAAATTWSSETIVTPADTGKKVYVYTGSSTVQTFDDFYASDD